MNEGSEAIARWLEQKRHTERAWAAVLCVLALGSGASAFLLTSVLVGGLIDTWVKLAVGRERPSLEHPVATAFGKSFPSGHAMSSTIAYGALLLVLLPLIPAARRRLAIVATIGWLLMIGFTRLALGVHYITDVLGGYALGAAWLTLNTAAFEIWREERGLRRTQPLEEGVGAV